MQAPPANAQSSATPFRDVVDLGTAIARARGLDAAHADVAGRISLGIFFAESNGNQNIGNARSNKYKGSFQTGMSEQSEPARGSGRRSSRAIAVCRSGIDRKRDDEGRGKRSASSTAATITGSTCATR
jgi:hypothetical protein